MLTNLYIKESRHGTNLTMRVYVTGVTVALIYTAASTAMLATLGLAGYWLCDSIERCARDADAYDKAGTGGLMIAFGLLLILIPVRMFIRNIGERFWYNLGDSETQEEIKSRWDARFVD